MANLHYLLVESLDTIDSCLDPSSHFPFAKRRRPCKVMDTVEAALLEHQVANVLYCNLSGRLPCTIPDLLRTAIGVHIPLGMSALRLSGGTNIYRPVRILMNSASIRHMVHPAEQSIIHNALIGKKELDLFCDLI